LRQSESRKFQNQLLILTLLFLFRKNNHKKIINFPLSHKSPKRIQTKNFSSSGMVLEGFSKDKEVFFFSNREFIMSFINKRRENMKIHTQIISNDESSK